MKSVQIRNFSGPYFPVFSPNNQDLNSKSSYFVQIRKYGPEKNVHLCTFHTVDTTHNLGSKNLE